MAGLGIREGRSRWSPQVWPRNRWRLKRLRRDRQAQLLVKCVSAARGIPLYDLLDGRRGVAAVCEARQLAMYLVHVVLSRSQDTVGSLFGRRRSTVYHACHVIEDLRESSAVDAEIDGIERRFAELLHEVGVDDAA
jgi:chromosomal replication initiation ATPase DnaA